MYVYVNVCLEIRKNVSNCMRRSQRIKYHFFFEGEREGRKGGREGGREKARDIKQDPQLTGLLIMKMLLLLKRDWNPLMSELMKKIMILPTKMRLLNPV